jgi:hypothetical protein
MSNGKSLILAAISNLGGTATSLSICDKVALHSASIDKLLKNMVEAGELTREKKAPGNGITGREVFHYSIPKPTHTSAEDHDDEDMDDDDDNDTWGDDDHSCNDDSDWEDEDDEDIDMNFTNYDEVYPEDEEDEEAGPNYQVGSPNVVFLVRKDDIEGFTYGHRGHLFAREISQFVKFGSRRFERHGRAVISIFISETPRELITAHMRAALPEITFKTVYDLSDAIEAIQEYSDEIGKAFYVENFRIFYNTWKDYNGHLLPNRRDTAILVPVNEAEADQPKTAGGVQPQVQSGNVIERLASNGLEYMNMSHTEMAEVFQKLAQFYLDYND